MAKVKSIDKCLLYFPVDYVYRTLTDFSSYSKWWPSEIKFELEHLNPSITGTTINVQNGFVKWKSKITGFRNNKLLAIDYIEGAWLGKTYWRVEDKGGDTELTMEIDLEINSSWLKPVSAVINFQKYHSRQIHRIFKNLEKYLAANEGSYTHTIRISHIDHIVLTVADIEKTCAFYHGVLGMEIVTFGEGRKALKFGSQKINLHQKGKEYQPTAASPAVGTGDMCFIANTAIELMINDLKEKGVQPIEGPVEREGANGKIISIYLRDPDNNLIEISNYINKNT
jgi:catechol 2,3-dioxygenase-like lactoylglutathione lyase family enzyme